MKFAVDTKSLVEALTSLNSNINAPKGIAALGQVHLQALEDGDVALTGNDCDMTQTVYLRARVEVPGEVCVEAKLLLAYAKGLPKGSEASFFLEDEKLIVKSGSSKSVFNTSDVSDFPVLESKFEDEKAFALEPAELLRALNQTAAAISNESVRYYLNGVYVTPVAEGADSLLRFVATDGKRLHKTAIQAPLHNLEHTIPGVIVPHYAVPAVMKLLKKAEKVRVHICPLRTEFQMGYKDGRFVIFATKNIDGTFPNYERVIPDKRHMKATVDRAQLERIAAEMGKRGASKYGTQPLKLSFTAGKLKISTKTGDFEGEESIDCIYDGPDVEVGYNGIHLSQCLKALEGEHGRDEAQFEWAEGAATTGPAVIVARDGGYVQTVLMPVRL